MFQKQDIYWVCLASTLMIGGYSLIWSSEPDIRSFRLRDEITAEQESSDSELEAVESSNSQQTLELARTPDESGVLD